MKKSLICVFLLLMMAFSVLAEEMPDELPTADPKETPYSEAADIATPAPDALPAILKPGGILVLVNPSQKITKSFVPSLTMPKVPSRKKDFAERIQMAPEAAKALESLFAAAKKEHNFVLFAVSGYRSFGIQQLLMSQKIEAVGSKEKALRTVAWPGTSEHQLGLAMDVQSENISNLNADFGELPEGKWVADNAHRFGFIVRYKAEWRKVTGYAYEPWHLRYLGIAHATAVHELNVPYEYYYAQISKLPEYVLNKAPAALLSGLVREMMDGKEPEALQSLLSAQGSDEDTAIKEATLPYLKAGESYDQALWASYPTPEPPKPTSAPRVDTDEETTLSQEPSAKP